MKKYDKYKDSGVEWLGEIPEHWGCVKLRRFSSVQKGKKANVEYLEFKDDRLPYLAMEFLRGLTDNPIYIDKSDPDVVLVKSDDILILWDGSKAGEIVKSRYGALSSTMAKLLFDGNFQVKFLFNMMKVNEHHLQINTIGMGIPHVDGEVLKNLPILTPSLSEQTVITSYLNYKTTQIDTLIEKKERLIKKLKQQRQSIINEVVTNGLNPNVPMKDSGIEWLGEIPEHWSTLKLGRTFSNIGSGTTPRSSELSYYENGRINWLNTGDLNDSYITGTAKKITQLAVDDYSILKEYSADSIVIALYGATIGKLGHLRISTTTNQACCVISESEKITQRFLFYYFRAARKFIISKSYGGGQPNISQDLIKQLYIPTPSVKDQIEITSYLDCKTVQIDTLIDKEIQQIKKLELYCQSLISEAVTGKIDVRDWKKI